MLLLHSSHLILPLLSINRIKQNFILEKIYKIIRFQLSDGWHSFYARFRNVCCVDQTSILKTDFHFMVAINQMKGILIIWLIYEGLNGYVWSRY